MHSWCGWVVLRQQCSSGDKPPPAASPLWPIAGLRLVLAAASELVAAGSGSVHLTGAVRR
jgi:hypothetical protein